MAQVQRRQFNDIFEAVGSGSLAVADPASLADAAGVSHSVTVSGAALGDIVMGVSLSDALVGALTVTGNVTAANTVTVRVQNESGSAVDLGAFTIKVAVGRIRI
jgi:hypothetical protein